MEGMRDRKQKEGGRGRRRAAYTQDKITWLQGLKNN